METIQIVLDRELLDCTDTAAKRLKQNRSALVRKALHAYLNHLDIQMKEEQDKAGYARFPHDLDEPQLWASEAAWPPE